MIQKENVLNLKEVNFQIVLRELIKLNATKAVNGIASKKPPLSGNIRCKIVMAFLMENFRIIRQKRFDFFFLKITIPTATSAGIA